MRKSILLLTLAFFLVVTSSQAQYELAKDGLAARITFINYQWPSLIDDFNTEDFSSGLEIEYVRHLNSFLNLGLPLKIAKVNLPTDEIGGFESAGLTSLDAVLQLKFFHPRSFIYPYLYAGLGVVAEDFEDFGFAAPLGMSFNFRLGHHIYLTTKAEYRIGFEDLRDNSQIAGGLLVLLGPGEPEPEPVTDMDSDGIPDDQDLCPTEAGTAALNGCPDVDGDGIADASDLCPEVAGLPAFNGCPDSDGDGIIDSDDDCPEEYGTAEYNGCPLRDADSDGIPDQEDACPGEAGPASLNGCPDRDGDGIADRDDDCPESAGPAATNGCPDSDGDGIIDLHDRCPESAGPVSNNGCPEITEEEQQVLDFATQAVEFETGSATLRSTSLQVLDQIVEILRRYPDYSLRISGHTDSIGSSSLNQRLSEQRAESAYNYLVSKGISPDRMSYAGFGESRPIADNRYRDGREQNRRVEFDIYLQE